MKRHLGKLNYRKLKQKLLHPVLPKRMVLVVRSLYGAVLAAAFVFTALTVFTAATLSFPTSEPEVPVAPFPVGVDPNTKTIIEDPELDHFIANSGRAKWSLPSLVPSGRFARFIAKLSQSSWYQMAIPGGRLLVIFPGERKEEVAKNFGDILRWSTEERQQFLSLVEEAVPDLEDGQFYPERYLVAIDASPEDVAKMVVERFETEVVSRYDENAEERLPMKEAIIIASLLEREAYDFTDMREISGVIWNRLFIDMNLQLDATLQYARGSQANATKWWPVPTPADKYIESPYNTYKYAGLTPEPISNPSLEAVLAALNPAITDCLFYFHDSSSNFHCSADYKEHVAKLRQIYGQGK
jgi:cell division protein YceG involved in septum cleavage